jgi:hypothetical protein
MAVTCPRIMKAIGVFRELGRGVDPSVQSIHSVVGLLDEGVAERVVQYLRSGVPVYDVMEATLDPLDNNVSVSGGPSLISDGTWVWREDLAYYVERYKLGLPREFLSSALERGKVAADDPGSIVARWEDAVAAYELAEKGDRGK